MLPNRVSSVHHHSWVRPVEFLTSHRQSSSHALEYVAHSLMHPLNLSLVVGLGLVDCSDDAICIGVLQWNSSELFLETKVDVAILKVVIVNLDASGKLIALCVDEP